MIHLTDSAQARVRRYTAKEAGALGIIIAVNKSGCSGYGYDIQIAQPDAVKGLQSFDYQGFSVFVSEEDLTMLSGLTLDVKKQGLNEFFTFDNPQAAATCGCGTSFSLEK